MTDVSDVSGFPEMLDGRVKTLHPRIAAGVLADMRSGDHREQLAAQLIEPFELIVVNLYPFAQAAAREGTTDDELIEQIDIGGPTLVRAAAKNHENVGIVTDPAQYDAVLLEVGHGGGLSDDMRRELAAAAFRLTAGYDTLIAEELTRRWWHRPDMPWRANLDMARIEELRYGENPHQSAALYGATGLDLAPGAFSSGPNLLQGKPLSYNNILDAAAATGLARDLRGAGCAIVKHANPCGAAEAANLAEAWRLALAGDPVSAFGGVVALNQPVDAEMARLLTSIFLEVVAAPAYDTAALELLGPSPTCVCSSTPAWARRRCPDWSCAAPAACCCSRRPTWLQMTLPPGRSRRSAHRRTTSARHLISRGAHVATSSRTRSFSPAPTWKAGRLWASARAR